MSILIKGMEMPINWGVKSINIFSDGKVTYVYDLDNKQIATAVPVPPHGQLIDADLLMEEAKRISGPITGDGWDNFGVYGLIERQPTVIEAEENHD